MFEPLPAKCDFPAAELRILDFWHKHDVFGKSLEIRADSPRFVFYEGPPTANGMPHPGHCLTRAIKDLFPRYQTMCGKLVERKAGWDTHGLPVEVEVCKQLGIHTKEEIEEYGVEKFVRRCIDSVFSYVQEWEHMTRRLGFWVNLDEAYVTFHQSYVESVWWGLKTLFERGLLYQGHKVVWWWAQGGTALSAGEVGEGYRTVQDPSVYVRFPLKTEPEAQARVSEVGEGEAPAEPPHGKLPADVKVSLLVWTTTPWTLVSNHFAAVGPDIDYSLVHDQTTNEYLYVATALVHTTAEKVGHEFTTVSTCKGTDLVGLRYEPPFRCYYDRVPPRYYGSVTWMQTQDSLPLRERTAPLKDGGEDYIGWRITLADFVTLDAGTGLVHEAPAYGEVDFELLQQERQRFTNSSDIPLINAVAPDGTFNKEAPEVYRGKWVKDCDKDIISELKERGILLHQEMIEHEYPFCPRAEDDPLIQYARKSWFVRTSQFKDEFLKNNDGIYWLPEYIKEGRFGDFLRNNVDWALSRERYWGTPLPIWVCEQCGKQEAFGSLAELMAKSGATDGGLWEQKKAEDPELPDHLRVHKPYIDAWSYISEHTVPNKPEERCKGTMRRVPEVIDCWWDAGSMPFAQWGFPHVENSVKTFAERFPADFISEALDQTRGWFYGMLAISTLLFSETGRESGSVGVPPALTTRGVTEQLAKRRRLLPHWEAGGATYFLTFRPRAGDLAERERDLVLAACRHWDGQRILVHAVAVMPDHVHLLITPLEKQTGVWWSIGDLMHSIKSFTAKRINELRGTAGTVWQREYFDRIVRNQSDFEEKWNYIVTNPERRGLPASYQWVWVEPSHGPAQEAVTGERRDACYRRDADAPRRDADAPRRDADAPRRDADAPRRDADAPRRDADAPRRDADAPRMNHAPQAEYPHPYRACVVLGLMMGEDGSKMSKRKKNYREPNYIFDHYGADALRWFLFSGQTPWTSIRFQEQNIRDSQREFLVRLYNVFSFFNIYANIDGFEPAAGGQGTVWRAVAERAELDRWIINELHRTTRAVREHLDRFENFPAAGWLNNFVDALSNWYVRRSRVRFWKGVKDQDKWDAYNTLYEVLVTLSKLIAPFTPFFAETMYQNLVRGHGAKGPRGQGEEGPISVHLCDYPEVEEGLIDEDLAREMDLVRQIVSLGRAARTDAKLKVRQPLALAEIILVHREQTDWLKSHTDLITDELNIKAVEFTTEADQYVTYEIKPNFKALGPKFGQMAPKIAGALGKIDAAAARQSLHDTGELIVDVDGQRVHLTSHDVHVQLKARSGWSASQGRAGVVVVKTELTPELQEEGLVRELVHHVQALRKEHDLAYEARITLYIEGPDELLDVVRRHADTLQKECLAERVEYAAGPGVELREVKVESYQARVGLVII
ncbi:MAG: class I tRNA ligase family protein [Planctomycetota bacterium]